VTNADFSPSIRIFLGLVLCSTNCHLWSLREKQTNVMMFRVGRLFSSLEMGPCLLVQGMQHEG
jgi:hypothetical protein